MSEIAMAPFASLLSVGLAVGFLVGLSGMGGGALMTPALIFMGFPPLQAVGVDLAYMSITKAFGSFLHYRRGHIDFKSVKFLLAGSLTTSFGVFFVLKYLLEVCDYEFINNLIGVMLAIIVLSVALINLARLVLNVQSPTEDVPITTGKIVFLVSVGGLVGTVIQFTSVGTGVIVTTVLMSFLSSHRVVGTDVFYGFVVTTFCALLHWSIGNIDFNMLLPLILGSLPGMYLGVRICHRIPARLLRGVLIAVLIGVSVMLLHQRAGALFGG